MPGRLFALLVGIDAYIGPINPLAGCRNDIAALSDYLRARADGPDGAAMEARSLFDAEATRDAVVAAFREHLGRAGPGDVALFAYAGHGSEEPAPLEVAHLEPTGRIQTLVLYDCGQRIDGRLRRGLADKELAVLIAEVANKGAHVVLVLDCCNSGGATRDPMVNVRGWTPDPESAATAFRDLVTELQTPRPVEEFLPGTVDHWTAPNAPHVALSACRSFERAKELRQADTTQGAFSIALIDALSALGPRSTYRSVLTTARAHVERITDDQHPELFPLDPGTQADALFLDGRITPTPAAFTMTRGRDGWEVDGGLVHGLRPPQGDEAFILACYPPGEAHDDLRGTVRVTAVDVGRSTVEPIEWSPDQITYRAVIADVPLPPALLAFDLPTGDIDSAEVAAVVERVRRALAISAPGGDPSPYVRTDADQPAGVRLRGGVPAAGMFRIGRSDGSPVTADTPVADDAGARLAVARLEHVAKWEQVRALGEQPSPLADTVRIEVFRAEDGERFRSDNRAPLTSTGAHHVEYRVPADGPPLPSSVFIEVCNSRDEALWVAVLDLTDRFRCHAALPTVALAAGHRISLADGAPIPVTLPAGRPVAPGARARDWLKLIVSDVEFDASAFDLPALDEPPEVRSVTRSSGPLGTLERLAGRAVRGDVSRGPRPAVARWTASTVTIETSVPAR